MKKLRGGAEEDCSDENGGSGGGERGGEREPRAPTEGLGGSWATRGGGKAVKYRGWGGERGGGARGTSRRRAEAPSAAEAPRGQRGTAPVPPNSDS